MENSDNRIYKQFYSMDFKINDLVTVILLHTLSMFQRRKLLMKKLFLIIFSMGLFQTFLEGRGGVCFIFLIRNSYTCYSLKKWGSINLVFSVYVKNYPNPSDWVLCSTVLVKAFTSSICPLYLHHGCQSFVESVPEII